MKYKERTEKDREGEEVREIKLGRNREREEAGRGNKIKFDENLSHKILRAPWQSVFLRKEDSFSLLPLSHSIFYTLFLLPFSLSLLTTQFYTSLYLLVSNSSQFLSSLYKVGYRTYNSSKSLK